MQLTPTERGRDLRGNVRRTRLDNLRLRISERIFLTRGAQRHANPSVIALNVRAQLSTPERTCPLFWGQVHKCAPGNSLQLRTNRLDSGSARLRGRVRTRRNEFVHLLIQYVTVVRTTDYFLISSKRTARMSLSATLGTVVSRPHNCGLSHGEESAERASDAPSSRP
jgi:hypothetical protein